MLSLNFLRGSALAAAIAITPLALLAGDAALKDGTYHGKAKGYKGPIEVEVLVKGGKIAEVKIGKNTEDRPRSALKEIPDRIVKAQSVEVDSVAGATYTSNGVKKAVAVALESAGLKKAAAGETK